MCSQRVVVDATHYTARYLWRNNCRLRRNSAVHLTSSRIARTSVYYDNEKVHYPSRNDTVI